MRKSLLPLLMVIVLPLLLAGCGSKAREIASFSKADYANILTQEITSQLSTIALSGKQAGISIAVLTVNDIPSKEPVEYANRAFASYPYYRDVISGPQIPKLSFWQKSWGCEELRVKEAWQPNGILILYSQNPRLIQVRVGTNLSRSFSEADINTILTQDAYPLLDQGKGRLALLHLAKVIVERAANSSIETKHPGWFRRTLNSAISALKDISFPKYRWYYTFVFDPLFNSLLVLSSLFGGQSWVILVWVLIITLLFRSKPVSIVFCKLNLGLLRLFGIPRKGSIRTQEAANKFLNGIISFSLFEAKMFRFGLTIPIFAAISLFIAPLRENILTMQNHTYPFLHSMVASNAMVMTGKFLWWESINTPAGIWMAVFFGIFAIPAAIMQATSSIAAHAETIDSDNAIARELSEQSAQASVQGVIRSVFFSIAVGLLPVGLVLYIAILAFEEFFEQWANIKHLKKKLESPTPSAAAR